jgi:hypothetical protein
MGQSGDTSMGLRSDDDFKEIMCNQYPDFSL